MFDKQKNKTEERFSKVFVILSLAFTTCLLMSNILAAKLLKVGIWSITAGVLVFPLSYIVNDLLTEVYGYRVAKLVIYVGFVAEFFMVAVFALAIILPAPEWFAGGDEFAAVLGTTPRVAVASLAAYLVGSLANSRVLSRMKASSKEDKGFWIRAIVSTIAGEGLDSIIFIPIVFWGDITLGSMISMIALQVIIKTMYEFLCLPITQFLLRKVKEYEIEH